MADDENNQPKKSRGILKILGFVFGGSVSSWRRSWCRIFHVW